MRFRRFQGSGATVRRCRGRGGSRRRLPVAAVDAEGVRREAIAARWYGVVAQLSGVGCVVEVVPCRRKRLPAARRRRLMW